MTSYNQGLDANSLNKTATGVSQIMQATQQRVELVARTFANQLKDLFMLVHHLVRTCYTRPEIIRLRDEWVEVDPREWKERK
ncbi:portal protein, partial [Streptococcus pneumoniae]|uniref:portal protein n=1 Tax=Streptococcus pneumoniae TaxID=1313 RepID=UPI0040367063